MLPIWLTCLLLWGCSPRQTQSTLSKHSVPQEQNFVFLDGTKMHVRERLGETLKGVHIVKRSPDGNQESIDAEKGEIASGAESRGMRIVLRDAHVDLGSKGRFIATRLNMDLVKEMDKDSLEKIARDLRRTRVEPGGAANGSQPIRSETNRTSSAAGSRR